MEQLETTLLILFALAAVVAIVAGLATVVGAAVGIGIGLLTRSINESTIETAELWSHIIPILIAWAAVTFGRGFVIFAKHGILRALGQQATMPLSWATAPTWGGLRGGLSMVLALALPASFVHRELILHLTFGVVLLSLLAQGLSMPVCLRKLKLVGARDKHAVYEESQAAMRATRAALKDLPQKVELRLIAQPVYERFRAQYEQRMLALEEGLAALHLERREIFAEQERAWLSHYARGSR